MMNRKWNQVGTVATCLAALLCAGVVGCSEKDKGHKDTTDQPKSGDTTAAQTNEPPADDTGWKQTEPADDSQEKPVATTDDSTTVARVDEPTPQPEQPVNQVSKEDQRQAVMDAVYANIRLQMEQAITERKQLLDAGTAPSDERVRALEGKIMKARELLVDNGESVDDVDPPIVQTQP
ncbi:MAG: hypothetical protein IPK83_23820 [Planctomycetes bacterium]|nr:hypothetical protein [Planctomycetota bacterium]